MTATDLPTPDAPGRARPGPGRLVVPAVLAAVALAVLAVVAWPDDAGGPPALAVTDAAAGPGTESAAVYLTVTTSGGDDRLVAASSPAARTAVLHDTSADGAMTGGAPGAVTGDAPLRLRPGGAHLMLEGLHRPLVPGTTVAVQLRFERAGTVEVSARVVAYQDVPTLAFEGADR